MSTNQMIAQSNTNGKLNTTLPDERTEADRGAAISLRECLYDAGAYPLEALDTDNNIDHRQADDWRSEMLHPMIENLTPTDRAAIFEVVRWLLLSPTADGEILLLSEFADL